MRRFSGRLVAVVVVALCLSVVPVGVASAAPWSDLAWQGGLFLKVELVVARLLARFEFGSEKPGLGVAVLDEGAELDENGAT